MYTAVTAAVVPPWILIFSSPLFLISHLLLLHFTTNNTLVRYMIRSSAPLLRARYTCHHTRRRYTMNVARRAFLPARRYASAGYSDRNESVRPSVTRRYCVKTKKASSMISSPSVSPKTLVFRRQISSPNSKGFRPNKGLKQGSVGKIQRFSTFKLQYLENGSRYGQSYY